MPTALARTCSLPVALAFALALACAGDDGDGTAGSSSTTTSDGSSGSGGDESALYGPCDEICTLDFDACIKPGDGMPLEFCTKTCAAADECPAAASGTATPVCIDAGSGSICALDCAGVECPEGMTCKLVGTVEGARSLCFSSPP